MSPENLEDRDDPESAEAGESEERESSRDPGHAEPQVGVVVVTHGRAAEAMLAAARAILGRIPALAAVTAPVGAEMHALVEKISQACEDVDQGAGVLLLVDVHGSTPFHAAMTMLDGTRPAEVLCGVNLPMLIKLTNLDRTQGPPVVLAEELRDAGRRSIRLGSELTGKVGIEERR
jgi:PTS system mannose-specific IIA component